VGSRACVGALGWALLCSATWLLPSVADDSLPCLLTRARVVNVQELMESLHRHCNSGYMSDSLPMVVVGAPGSGKTSLVAAFAKQCVMSLSVFCRGVPCIPPSCPCLP
jgi:Cdc6-like AAA superfamily ATPase